MAKHFLSITNLSKKEVESILRNAKKLKQNRKKLIASAPLKGKTLAMLFEKPSTRTRVSFEVGMFELGGHALYLDFQQTQLKRGESLADTAKVLSRYCSGIVARVFEHSALQTLASNSRVPVINGLSDLLHPCQALSDVFTMQEKKGKLNGLTLAYVGALNNVSNSLMLACSMLGINVQLFFPEFIKLNEEVLNEATMLAGKNHSSISLHNSIDSSISKADFLYTDVWFSMGEKENPIKENLLKEFQVNESLLEKCKKNVKIMHCLPAHKGREISSSVIDGKNSIVLDQAENRLHVQKALLVHLLE